MLLSYKKVNKMAINEKLIRWRMS